LQAAHRRAESVTTLNGVNAVNAVSAVNALHAKIDNWPILAESPFGA